MTLQELERAAGVLGEDSIWIDHLVQRAPGSDEKVKELIAAAAEPRRQTYLTPLSTELPPGAVVLGEYERAKAVDLTRDEADELRTRQVELYPPTYPLEKEIELWQQHITRFVGEPRNKLLARLRKPGQGQLAHVVLKAPLTATMERTLSAMGVHISGRYAGNTYLSCNLDPQKFAELERLEFVRGVQFLPFIKAEKSLHKFLSPVYSHQEQYQQAQCSVNIAVQDGIEPSTEFVQFMKDKFPTSILHQALERGVFWGVKINPATLHELLQFREVQFVEPHSLAIPA